VTADEIRVFDNAEALARAAAVWLFEKARSSAGRFAVCCSGGSTPKRLYELLGAPKIAGQFPWPRVHWFWGDERFVPHDHPDSNFGMTRKAVLSRVPVAPDRVHAVPTDGLTPEQAARAYERELREFYGAERLDRERPLFDVVLLGIGEDGHTASLFPGQPALDEARRWVVPVIGARVEARITLTFPALDSARDVVFLAVGENKRAVVHSARAGDHALPAARIRPAGPLHWFLDRQAAAP
jgi:6-phosphogluconolactonase